MMILSWYAHPTHRTNLSYALLLIASILDLIHFTLFYYLTFEMMVVCPSFMESMKLAKPCSARHLQLIPQYLLDYVMSFSRFIICLEYQTSMIAKKYHSSPIQLASFSNFIKLLANNYLCKGF